MFWSIVTFFLVLSILVLVHEFGHYIVAKKNGIWVEEFGFGLPPRVFGKKIGDTIYSINLLPFGGFVRLYGEMEEETKYPKVLLTSGSSAQLMKSKQFINKSLWVKTAVIVAGVVMNFLLAIFAFSIVYFFTGIPRETKDVKIVNVAPDSPALNAKLVVGDVIKKVDGKDVTNVAGFVAEIEGKKGKKVTLELQDRKVTITPRAMPPVGQGPLGVSLSTIEIYYPPYYQRPFYGVYYGFKDSIFWSKNVINGFTSIFKDISKGNAPKDISGPVGVFAVTTEAAKTGILSLINLIGIISVNLAILNIIPFPALDGGRLLFIVIEAIFGKKVAPKIESVIHSVGMFILLALILLITIGDVRRLVEAGSISGFIQSITSK